MKRIKVVLLGTIVFQATFAQTRNLHHLYSYDGAGNTILRVNTFRYGQNDMSDNDNTNNNREEDSRVTIKTDASWSEVLLEIIGDITQSDMLSIYTSDGFFVMSYRIESNKFSLNLSTLREGTYLFRFRLNKKISQKKYIKEN